MAARSLEKPNKSEGAFQKYCSDPIVQKALEMAKDTLTENLLRDCFMAGAGYAIARCNAETSSLRNTVMEQADNRFYRQKDHGPFCPKCGERENIAPQTKYWSNGPGRPDGLSLTGKTECRNCNHVF